MIVSSAEAMNPSRRNTMEDRHTVHPAGTWNAKDPSITYLAIMDGHGGRDMVDFLEHALPYHIAQELGDDDNAENDSTATTRTTAAKAAINNNNAPSRTTISMETRLERAFLMTDVHARQVGITASGATVVVCLVKPMPETKSIQLIVANAGDARAVLGQAGRPAERLTVDHRPDDAHEARRIAQAGGFCWKHRVLGVLAVTRSLGDQLLKEFVIAEPAVRQTEIARVDNDNDDNHNNKRNEPQTADATATSAMEQNNNTNSNNNKASSQSSFVILACDGLWDVMSDNEAVELVRSYPGEKETVADHLVSQGLARGTADNVTCVVAWL